MSYIGDIGKCLICCEKFQVMISLKEILNECGNFSVLEVLEHLNFLSISDFPNLNPSIWSLCCTCVSQIQSCFQFKTLCGQVQQALKDQAINKYDELSIDYTNLEEVLENHTKEMIIDPLSEKKFHVEIDEGIFTQKSTSNEKMIGKSSNTRELYKCFHCIETFQDKAERKKHFRLHQNGKLFVCEICHKSFSTLKVLLEHKKAHKKKTDFNCSVCHKGKTQPLLSRHLWIRREKKLKYVCASSTKSYDDASTSTPTLLNLLNVNNTDEKVPSPIDEKVPSPINENLCTDEDYFEETVPSYSDKEFLENFHLSRKVVNTLTDMLTNSNYNHYQSGANGKIVIVKQLLVFIWFAGHQTCSFREVAERFSITISCLHKIITNVTSFLSGLSSQFVQWPSVTEQEKIESHFRRNGFPGVIGIIDGSHVKIDKPMKDVKTYKNKNKRYSIKFQVVCDHERRIRDVVIGYPGSFDDNYVFQKSSLSNTLKDKCCNFYIIGDSGYPCLKNLLTPYQDNGDLTETQQRYNTLLSNNRRIVDECIGNLKQRFRQLFHIKLRKVENIVHFIKACCVLHNMTIGDDFQYDNEEIFPTEENEPADQVQVDSAGAAMRDFVAQYIL